MKFELNDWIFTRTGRAWEGDELTERHALLPEPTRIEVQNGKLFWNDEERLTVFAMLLENLGIEKVAPLIDPELYLDALMSNDIENEKLINLLKLLEDNLGRK